MIGLLFVRDDGETITIGSDATQGELVIIMTLIFFLRKIKWWKLTFRPPEIRG